jgi:hypothetical protein
MAKRGVGLARLLIDNGADNSHAMRWNIAAEGRIAYDQVPWVTRIPALTIRPETA